MAAGYVRPQGRLDVATALEPYSGPWDNRLAAHLLRRAGFGGTPDEIARFAGMSAHAAVESMIHPPDSSSLPAFDVMPYPSATLASFRGLDEMTRRENAKELRKSAVAQIVGMEKWWLTRMLTTPAPLIEKMTFVMHGHFTTAAIQKGVWPNMVYAQNQLFRSYALGNLRDLTLAVSKDPAMLLYLDNAENNKTHPNENYARELMELFTLGIGNYSEEDIRQSARAFTGWTVDRKTGAFFDNPRTHDDGTKTFLSKSGAFTGADIVSTIYQQRACERFWATTLLAAFVYDDPEPELVDAFANLIARNRYELAPTLSVLLQSNVFYSSRAYRALVKSPVEFAIGAHKTLGLAQIADGTPASLRAMGQVLFYPPNVAGWPGGANWLTTQMLIARENFVQRLVNAPQSGDSTWLASLPNDPRAAARTLIVTILQNDASSDAPAQLVGYLEGSGTSALAALSVENRDERLRNAAYLTMAMPAYQLG
jgi:uncharacterized protein (DUF1800 family)